MEGFRQLGFPEPNELPSLDNAVRLVELWLRSLDLQHIPRLEAFKITGGITNILFRVVVKNSGISTLCSAGQSDRAVNDISNFVKFGVGVRFVGSTKKQLVDRHREALILDFLAAEGFCKRPLHRFEGGQIDEWRVGRSLTLDEMGDEEIMAAVARRLGWLHGLTAELQDVHPEWFKPDLTCPLWDQITLWLKLLKDHKQRVDRILSREDTGIQTFEQLGELKNLVRLDNNRFGRSWRLCHNDLLSGNILLVPCDDPEDPHCLSFDRCHRIEFIDFEYSAVGDPMFDVANFFCESAGFICDWSRLPGRRAQEKFLTAYNKALRQLTSPSPATGGENDSDTDTSDYQDSDMLNEVQSFMWKSHLYWGLWALAQAILRQQDIRGSGDDNMNYSKYGSQRLKLLVNQFFKRVTH